MVLDRGAQRVVVVVAVRFRLGGHTFFRVFTHWESRPRPVLSLGMAM